MAIVVLENFAQTLQRALKMANAGGMAVERVVAERWKKATGIPLVEANSLTETSPGAICLRSPQVMAGY